MLQKRLRQEGIFTISDVLERDASTGAAITRKHAQAHIIVKALKDRRLIWSPAITGQLTNFPARADKSLIWHHARIADSPLTKYRPWMGRKSLKPQSTSEPNWARWEIRSPPQMTYRWKKIAKTHLDSKHLSLIWLLAHAAVPTAIQLTHCVPGLSPNCPACLTSRETIQHYFWSCSRTRRFWQLVSRFITNIQSPTSRTAITVDPPMVVTGFDKWSRNLPNAATLHGLAVWEIYRSHAELSDEIKRTGDQMFIRWKETLTLRILHDLTYAYSTLKSPEVFRSRWLTVPNRWFHLEPGGSDRQDRLVFAGLSPSDPRFSYFLDSQGQIGSTTDEPAAALTTP